MLWSTKVAVVLAKIALGDKPLYTPCNVSLTLEIFSYPNVPYPTTLSNILSIPETVSLPNIPYLTILIIMLTRAVP